LASNIVKVTENYKYDVHLTYSAVLLYPEKWSAHCITTRQHQNGQSAQIQL